MSPSQVSVTLSSEVEGEEAHKWCYINKLVHQNLLVMNLKESEFYDQLSIATFPEHWYFSTYRPYCLDYPIYGPGDYCK